ncbi:MAG: hypothetical protein QM501_13340 [Gimesia sp.]
MNCIQAVTDLNHGIIVALLYQTKFYTNYYGENSQVFSEGNHWLQTGFQSPVNAEIKAFSLSGNVVIEVLKPAIGSPMLLQFV